MFTNLYIDQLDWKEKKNKIEFFFCLFICSAGAWQDQSNQVMGIDIDWLDSIGCRTAQKKKVQEVNFWNMHSNQFLCAVMN